MHTYTDGRHEHGQNFLTDRRAARRVVDLVAETSGPILEVGPGQGALTLPMQRLGRPITAVEIHRGMATRLSARAAQRTEVITADFLRYPMPQEPHVVVGNLPFHLTTAIMRKLMHSRAWTDAVLIAQWEVARRRAGIGGATMMTAQWSPYYSFGLAGRIPARAYTPAPHVDAGIITISRRSSPLLPWGQRKQYTGFVHQVFTSRGRGISQMLRSVTGADKRQVGQWLGELSIRSVSLPKDLSAEQWAGLYRRSGGDTRRKSRSSTSQSRQARATKPARITTT